MWDVSERFLDAVATSHEIVTRVEIWRDGLYVQDLPVTGGTVTVDESSKVRRGLDISSSNIALNPRSAEDLLAPFGTELRVFTGLRYTEGDTELVPVGVFGITNAGRSGWLADLGISADDRSRVVADSRLILPYTPSSASTIAATITTLCAAVYPDVEVFDLTDDIKASQTAPPRVTLERERWDGVELLMSGLAAEAFFDQEGRVILRDVPQVTADAIPVWSVAAGTVDAALIDMATSLSGDQVYNAVVASSSADGVLLTRVVYQRTGALRWRAGFQRPRFYSSPLIRTAEQAISAATAILARSLVFAQGVTLEALPNPALDVGDLISVARPDGLTERRIVSKLTIPLDLGSMSIDTRTSIDTATATDVGELE